MKTFFKIILGLAVLIFLYMQFFPPPADTNSQVTSVEKSSGPDVKSMVEDLSTSEAGNYSNYHFLVLQPDSFNVAQASYIAAKYCSDHCNQLYYWKDRKAYELLMEKRSRFTSAESFAEEKKWKKKHWVYVCENLLATNAQGDVDLMPYLDEDYRKYGGKRKPVDE